MKIVGNPVERVDAIGKVTGQTLFPGDVNLPEQAYMKILFSNQVHARITRLDTQAAESLDGVLAVYTAQDVPNNEYGLIIPDQALISRSRTGCGS